MASSGSPTIYTLRRRYARLAWTDGSMYVLTGGLLATAAYGRFVTTWRTLRADVRGLGLPVYPTIQAFSLPMCLYGCAAFAPHMPRIMPACALPRAATFLLPIPLPLPAACSTMAGCAHTLHYFTFPTHFFTLPIYYSHCACHLLWYHSPYPPHHPTPYVCLPAAVPCHASLTLPACARLARALTLVFCYFTVPCHACHTVPLYTFD